MSDDHSRGRVAGYRLALRYRRAELRKACRAAFLLGALGGIAWMAVSLIALALLTKG